MNETTIKIKPLSVNSCWQGRRFKSKEYKTYYEPTLYRLLPKIDFDFSKPCKLRLVFGFSNRASDIDNPIKPILDVMQKRYSFNDKNIYKLEVEKEIVKKGEEYFSFELEEMLIKYKTY